MPVIRGWREKKIPCPGKKPNGIIKTTAEKIRMELVVGKRITEGGAENAKNTKER